MNLNQSINAFDGSPESLRGVRRAFKKHFKGVALPGRVRFLWKLIRESVVEGMPEYAVKQANLLGVEIGNQDAPTDQRQNVHPATVIVAGDEDDQGGTEGTSPGRLDFDHSSEPA